MSKTKKPVAVVKKSTPARVVVEREEPRSAMAGFLGGLLVGGAVVAKAALESSSSSSYCSGSSYCACSRCRTRRAETEAEEARDRARDAERRAEAVGSLFAPFFGTQEKETTDSAGLYARIDQVRKELDETNFKIRASWGMRRIELMDRAADLESELKLLKARI
jgi:hypothetical protein